MWQSKVPHGTNRTGARADLRAVGVFFRGSAGLFFANLAVLGGGFALVQGLLFLGLERLGSSHGLEGLSVCVTVLFELPIFQYTNWFRDKMGVRGMIAVGEAAWIVRAVHAASSHQ